MCGDTNRPCLGGTIAVLFPLNKSENTDSALSSYSLFFRDTNKANRTKAVFQMNNPETYHAFRRFEHVKVRIESVEPRDSWKYLIIDTFRKYGDICNTSQSLPPLHEFRLNMNQCGYSGLGTEMELELPEKLDLGVSEVGVIGRQVTIREGESILGIGVVGYN